MIKHYTYDGLGRLVRTQSPFPIPNTAKGMVRSERFYYDGIRRIQETRLDPVKSLAGALESDVQDEQLLGQAGAEPDPIGSSPWRVSQTGVSSGATVHGRFMQADPNATAMVLVAEPAFHGFTLAGNVDQFDPEKRFADGANLYQYLRSNVWISADPLGLYEHWEDFWDDALSSSIGFPGPSDFITGVLQAIVEEYSANLE